MNFASALFSLKRGFKIKRKDWIGYWQLEGDSIMIHCKDGRVFNLVDSEDILFTIEQMACDDWEVVTTVDNVGLPHNPEVKKDNRDMSIPVKEYYPKFISVKDDWWKHQPTCSINGLPRALCLRTNNGWTPYGFTDDQVENAKISDCKVCYKYNDKWIPWNEIKAKMLENETSTSAKMPENTQFDINLGTISPSKDSVSRNYTIYKKNDEDSEKTTSVDYNKIATGTGFTTKEITNSGNLGRIGYCQTMLSEDADNRKPFDSKTVNVGDIISDSSKVKIESTNRCRVVDLNNIK